ncbi:MAG: hypothetical protein Q4C54_02245 [Clostridia bacterium]|nr:hypothetical protein [Clostridia bacterium]
MKRNAIVFLNIFISIMMALGVVTYAQGQRSVAMNAAEESFEQATEVVSGIADNYLSESEAVCSNWASYINSKAMTMPEAMQYLTLARDQEGVYAQILWADTCTGLSREPSVAFPDKYEVDYSDRREQLFSGWTRERELYVTPRFTNNVTGAYAVAFCKKIQLLDDDGLMRDAILMRVIPNTQLASRWVFPAVFAGSSVGIIDDSGRYILKPDLMKNEDFFDFIYSYNRQEIDPAALQQQFRSGECGHFFAKNGAGVECIWSYKRLAANKS